MTYKTRTRLYRVVRTVGFTYTYEVEAHNRDEARAAPIPAHARGVKTVDHLDYTGPTRIPQPGCTIENAL